MEAVEELASTVGLKRACADLAVPRSGVYRRRARRRDSPPIPSVARSSPRRLKEEEKAAVLPCLHEERFQDCSQA